MGMFLTLTQQKTARTRILEFLREPCGGKWLGEPGFMTVAQIADGADVSKDYARRVLEKLLSRKEVRVAKGRPVLYAAL